MDPQLVLMLAGGTLLLLNGFIGASGASGRGSASSQGDLPDPIFSYEVEAASEPIDDRATLIDGVGPSEDGDLREA